MARTTRSGGKASSPKKEAPAKKKTTTKPKKATESKVEEVAVESTGAGLTRASKIAKAVGSKAKVQINAEKPGRGNFVVRVKGVEKPVVELLEMKRPFPPLKALDMDKVCADVIAALDA